MKQLKPRLKTFVWRHFATKKLAKESKRKQAKVSKPSFMTSQTAMPFGHPLIAQFSFLAPKLLQLD